MPCSHECDKTESDYSKVAPVNQQGVCLFPYINCTQCSAENVQTKLHETNILKRNKDCYHIGGSRSSILISDTDEELLIRICFSKVVRLRGLCLVSLDEEIKKKYCVEMPSKVNIYLNRIDVSFANCGTIAPTQSIDLYSISGDGYYTPVKASLFFRTASLTLHIPGNKARKPNVMTAIQHLGFFGEPSDIEVSKKAVTTVYETKPSVHDYGTAVPELSAKRFLC